MSDFFSGKLKEYSVRTGSYVDSHINNSRNKTIVTSSIDTNLLPGYETTHNGKVRDLYICNNYVVMVATDRQSAFDRALASIPYKGQVLNLTSMWWFKQTETLVPNHVLSCPHPNVTIGKRCTVFPVEFVMRGYITGTTSTSMWQNYNKGVRDYCGHKLQEGLKKNQKLDHIMLTPTTKSEIHDELISAEAIVSTGLMTQEDWNVCSDYAHKLFSFSQAKAMEMGLILVDTKYEFGKDKDGQICLIDEIQTPDSSRYWIADSYDQKMSVGEVNISGNWENFLLHVFSVFIGTR